MKPLNWNVRGLGQDQTFREAQQLSHENMSQICFLYETKITTRQMKEKRKKLKFQNCFAVSREGLGGGLAMLWNPDINVEIKSYSKHHVDVVVHSEKGSYWRCIGIYGHPESDQKKHTWELLRRLAALSFLPWLCFGDFNEVLNLNEKSGGRDRRASMVIDFREAIRDCGLMDLGSTGYPFTWSNR